MKFFCPFDRISGAGVGAGWKNGFGSYKKTPAPVAQIPATLYKTNFVFHKIKIYCEMLILI